MAGASIDSGIAEGRGASVGLPGRLRQGNAGLPGKLGLPGNSGFPANAGLAGKAALPAEAGKKRLGETRLGDELLGGVPLWAAASGKVRAARRPSNMWFACASAAGLLLASAVGLHAYISNAAPLAGQRAAKAVRFETWVQASTGLNVHGACKLCHADEELRAGISRGLERSLAGAFSTDAGVY
jgi:hypothetical protein